MNKDNDADQIPCPECDGRGLILDFSGENHQPCECCLGLGVIPIIIPFADLDEVPFEVESYV